MGNYLHWTDGETESWEVKRPIEKGCEIMDVANVKVYQWIQYKLDTPGSSAGKIHTGMGDLGSQSLVKRDSPSRAHSPRIRTGSHADRGPGGLPSP